jgi:hypothetical protein
MAILTMGGVIKRCGALLDDPANVRFTPDYLRPYIDQENESLEITLERVGVQQQQAEAIFSIPAAASSPNDLTPFFAAGGPLQYFLRPKYFDWKLQGQPDTSYSPSAAVDKLDDVPVGNLGCQQYRWTGGVILTTPSYTAVTLRIGFFALASDMYDDAAPVMRGIGNVLALQASVLVCDLNNGMGKLGARLQKNLARDKQNFCNLIVMQQQSKNIFPRSTKRGVATQISAGGSQFM